MASVKWWDRVWNPWRGCTPCRRKCAACYNRAPDSWFSRYGHDPSKVVRASRATFRAPLRYPPGTVVAVCLLSDFFHESADAWRDDAWDVMCRAVSRGVGPFVIPTSRPQRIVPLLHKEGKRARQPYGAFWGNIWFLCSIADQADADELLPEFLKVPVGHLGVSHEPALGVVDFSPWLQIGRDCYPCADQRCEECGPHYDCRDRHIEWLICGGCNHTGDPRWVMPIEAARTDRDQARAAGIPFMFKGHGEWLHESQARFICRPSAGRDGYHHVGSAAAGHLLDGREWRETPFPLMETET
ncbi:MAG TPA: DUF5131 family protein [Planctomycetota bacterium]|nr:DUF5131 family protein [Planctomycetota bacterium]HRR82928.1 DUF5131 family protein [Planctomycetota bacterium]HRT94784.1 DUF5131 family protein [Planctomycetota bacterium]